MRKRTLAVASLSLAAALTGVTAVAASAVPGDTMDNTITLTVDAGSLSIMTTSTGISLSGAPGQTATADLLDITVTDDRAGTDAWDATFTVTSFTSGTEGVTPIDPSALTYLPAEAMTTGEVTVTEAASPVAGNAVTPAIVQSATAVTGNNTANWDAALALAIPSNALASSNYTATLTHSVL